MTTTPETTTAPDWLVERRREGASLAQSLPLPGPKDKGWEFTDLSGLTEESFEVGVAEVTITAGEGAEGSVTPLEEALEGDGALVAGFRPEHVEIGEAPAGAASLRATTDVVEFLGNQELLHLRVGEEDLVAIVEADRRVRPGDVLDLYIPTEKLHLFAGEEEKALSFAN